MSGYTTAEVTINYLAHLGPAAAVTITLPVGTRCKRVDGEWAVDDEALLVRLTGNTHDPKYRYAWLPASAPVAEK